MSNKFKHNLFSSTSLSIIYGLGGQHKRGNQLFRWTEVWDS